MPYLILPSRRTSQPQGSVILTPFARRGLGDLFINGASVVTGARPTTFGTAPSLDVGPLGRRSNALAAYGGYFSTTPVNIANTEQTLILYGEVGAVSAAYGGLICTASSDGSAASMAVQTGGALQRGIYNATTHVTAAITGIENSGTHCVVVSAKAGIINIAADGVLLDSISHTPTAQTSSRIVLFGERSANAGYSFRGTSYLYGGWGVGWSKADAIEVSRQPWGYLFASAPRRIYFDAGAGGGGATTGVGSATGTSAADALSGSVASASGSSVAAAVSGSVAVAGGVGTAAAVSGAIGSATGASTASARAGSVGQATGAGVATATSGAIAAAVGTGTATATAGSIAQAAGTSTAAAYSSAASVASASGTSTATALSGSIGQSTGASTAAGYSSAASIASAAGTSAGLAIAGFVATSTAASTAIALSGAIGVAAGTSVANGVGLYGNAGVGNAAGTSAANARSGSIGAAAGIATINGVGTVYSLSIDDRYLIAARGRQFTAKARGRRFIART